MTRTINAIADIWATRVEIVRTIPAEQAIHHVADFGTYVAAAFSAASTSPTRDKLAFLLAHLAGACEALQALHGRLPETGTPAADTGPIPPLKRARY